MNFIIALALFILVGSAVPGTMLSSPEALYEAGLGKKAPPPCRELTPGEAHERQLDKKGKAATYSIDGEFVCLHGIFDQGDRSAYLEFLVRQAPGRAADAARAASRLVAARPELLHRPWAVEVISDVDDVRPHLKVVWEEALVSALGTGMVVRWHGAARRLLVQEDWTPDLSGVGAVAASSAGAGEVAANDGSSSPHGNGRADGKDAPVLPEATAAPGKGAGAGAPAAKGKRFIQSHPSAALAGADQPILLVVRTRWVQDADLLFDVTASTAPGQIVGRL